MSGMKLDNYKSAIARLNEAVTIFQKYKNDTLSVTARNSLIKCFEIAFELCWKALTDFLRNQGVKIDQVSPRAIFRKAHSMGYLKDEKLWLDLLDDRNNMVHIYRESMANEAAELIMKKYTKAMNELLATLDC